MSHFSAFWSQLTRPHLHDPTTSFTNRTVLITGANVGLGFSAALKFALLGANRIILGVRSVEKGRAAAAEIKAKLQRGSNAGVVVEVWELDMLDYASVTAFAKRAEGLERLDVVVLNAGVTQATYATSRYGWEVTLQINTLSTILLALLLLPKLKRTASNLKASASSHSTSTSTKREEGRAADTPTPTLVLVSSGNHLRIALSSEQKRAENWLEYFSAPENFVWLEAYSRSKLFLQACVPELCKLAEQPSSQSDPEETETETEPAVFVTTVCPGATHTSIGRGFERWWNAWVMNLLLRLFFRSAEEGSRAYVSAALLGKEGHGRFWQHDEFPPTSPALEGEEGRKLEERVWHEVVDALRRDVPEVMEVVKV